MIVTLMLGALAGIVIGGVIGGSTYEPDEFLDFGRSFSVLGGAALGAVIGAVVGPAVAMVWPYRRLGTLAIGVLLVVIGAVVFAVVDWT